MNMKVSLLGISKYIWKHFFRLWLNCFCVQQTYFSCIFAGGTWDINVESAANNSRRFCSLNLKGLWHMYLWLKFKMFPLIYNWESKRTKWKFKKFFLGGDSMQLERLTMCTNISSILKFVKILNYYPAQDLLNKINRSFLLLLWAEIFLRQFTNFWHTRLYFLRPL